MFNLNGKDNQRSQLINQNQQDINQIPENDLSK
jgi:hypothetical protein